MTVQDDALTRSLSKPIAVLKRAPVSEAVFASPSGRRNDAKTATDDASGPYKDQIPNRSSASNLPIVSILILNYNYGRHVEDAIQSVIAQTYPNIEAIVIDDASTDDSWATIQKLTAVEGPYPSVLALRMPTNSGQSVVAEFGLRRSTGSYVIFLDADDLLLPACVEAHIYAHLSSRLAVGFSSVDNFTMVDGRVVTAVTGPDFAAYIASGIGRMPNMLRPIDKAAAETWFGARDPVIDLTDIHLIPPPTCEPWCWSPTSGACFRRDAPALVLRGPRLAQMRWGTDAYLMRPISAICGSMLIDRPLMTYRVHGDNLFVREAPLARLRNYNAVKMHAGMTEIIRHGVLTMFDNIAELSERLQSPEFFFEAVRSQCECWHALEAPDGHRFLSDCLHRYKSQIIDAFGADWFNAWSKAIVAPLQDVDEPDARWPKSLLKRLRQQLGLDQAQP